MFAGAGRAFTTSRFGTLAPGNLFPRSAAVLPGRRPRPGAPCNESGLTDGLYYFQVTDPAGSVLLSHDKSIEQRLFAVTGGGSPTSSARGTTFSVSGP